MKVVYASLSSLLTDLKERLAPDWVHMAAALQQSTTDGSGVPLFTSWIVVTTELSRDRWVPDPRRRPDLTR